MITNPKQTAYEAHRAAHRAQHPIGPFVSPEGVALASAGRVVAPTEVTAEQVESARRARAAADVIRWKAAGLWS